MGRVVLVTGVSRDLGGRFARSICTDPEVDRVVGVDVVPPRHDLGDVRFVRADIRSPVIAKVIAAEEVDSVVHLGVIATPRGAGGRTSMKEINVIGTMQLLAACQQAAGVERLIVKSSAGVYGALLVSNHSGTIPLDGMMTAVVIRDHADRYLRMLGADLLFRLPFVGQLARKGGATNSCNEDAERMLSRGELVGVWPEGFKGIGKPFSERYKLQRFGRGGFVSAALGTGVPIVPCSVVGAEVIYPLVGNVPALARLLGVPYVPITPLFPWLGPLGMIPLPSKWLIELGEPMRTDSYAAGAADDPMLVFSVTDQVRETIQQTLYSLLIRRRSVFA